MEDQATEHSETDYEDPEEEIILTKVVFIGIDRDIPHQMIKLYLQTLNTKTDNLKVDDENANPISVLVGEQPLELLFVCNGKDMYGCLTTTHLKNASYIVLYYYTDNSESANDLEGWVKEIRRYCEITTSIIIVEFGDTTEKTRPNIETAKSLSNEHQLHHSLVKKDNDSLVKFLSNIINENITKEAINTAEEPTESPPQKRGVVHSSNCNMFFSSYFDCFS
ncbi:hypothetical protein EIN_173900 [Entamoeba invadens IP1]|uniref:Uncharacterized protein n=1 Tax=Entamoeba invadens IP1 TaxID=370355 RepID=A0A0A1TYR7_ENTIV|nr:hypothetical protein EIN_173900 [Entamoeba invadens IP1]ELP84715.1 hypothetical protein EIN_173900 [Entamoeba invadens IP1]|eukprot:XP_004184061.1 hypothetical protein EIN_173900 [Entamoeba invadens IP1]